ncbi:hypothetical protein EMIT0P4_20046 [Pseudomonas sp. IT-P4]
MSLININNRKIGTHSTHGGFPHLIIGLVSGVNRYAFVGRLDPVERGAGRNYTRNDPDCYRLE